MLITYQKQLELPLLKVLQENNTRWWSILIMLERLIEIVTAVNGVLCSQGKKHLVITKYDYDNMKLIVDLLRPFQDAI